MSHQLLSQLSIFAKNQVIRVRIARKWDAIIMPRKIVIGVDLLLTDEEGNGIHATIKNTDAQFLCPLLEEGSVYEISRFEVVPAKVSYNSVHLDQIISFTRRTRISQIQENIERYPCHYFSFASFEEIDERANSNKFLTDVIGMLAYLGPISTIQVSGTKEMINKRDVIIRLLSGENLKVTIWQDQFPQIREEELLQTTPKPVLIFAGSTVKSYMDDLYLSTSSATKIFVNLDIAETARIKESYGEENIAVHRLHVDPQPNQSPTEVRDATIAELLAMEPGKIQNTRVHCRAKIVKLDATTGWHYNACNRCWGTLRASAGAFWCRWHGKKDPLPIMRLNLRIRDETDEMGVVILGKLAENLTGISLKDMPVVHNTTKRELPAAATDILNKTYLLKIGLPNSAITAGILGYKIFDFELLELPAAGSSVTDDKRNEAESSTHVPSKPDQKTPSMPRPQCQNDMSQIPSDLIPEESQAKKPKATAKRHRG